MSQPAQPLSPAHCPAKCLAVPDSSVLPSPQCLSSVPLLVPSLLWPPLTFPTEWWYSALPGFLRSQRESTEKRDVKLICKLESFVGSEEQNEGSSGEFYKPPYKLTSDAHRKHREQPSEGTKEIIAVWAGRCGWVGSAWVGTFRAALPYAWGLGLHGNLWGGRGGDGGWRRVQDRIALASSFQLSRVSHPEVLAQISPSSTRGWAEIIPKMYPELGDATQSESWSWVRAHSALLRVLTKAAPAEWHSSSLAPAHTHTLLQIMNHNMIALTAI